MITDVITVTAIVTTTFTAPPVTAFAPAAVVIIISDLQTSWSNNSSICASPQGEGLCFPEDHWFDANAVLEDGHRRNLQRRPPEPAGQRRAVEGKYQRTESRTFNRTKRLV